MGKSDCFWFRKVSVLLALLQVSIALAPVMGHKAAVLTEPHWEVSYSGGTWESTGSQPNT